MRKMIARAPWSLLLAAAAVEIAVAQAPPRQAPTPAVLQNYPAVTEAQLTGDLARQLSDGVAQAAKSPFRTGASVTDFDVASHSFGFVATALLYAS